MTKHLRKTHTALPTFPSMAACSGATGIPLATLRAAKRAGAPGFDQANRVHLGLLLPWLFADGGGTAKGADWHARLKRAQALRAELETGKRRGELVEVAFLGGQLAKGGHGMRAALMNSITFGATRLAAAGDDVAGNRAVLRELMWDAFDHVGKAMLPFLETVDAHTRAEVEKILTPDTDENEKTNDEKAPAHDDGGAGPKTPGRKRPRRGSASAGTVAAQANRPDLGGEVRASE